MVLVKFLIGFNKVSVRFLIGLSRVLNRSSIGLSSVLFFEPRSACVVRPARGDLRGLALELRSQSPGCQNPCLRWKPYVRGWLLGAFKNIYFQFRPGPPESPKSAGKGGPGPPRYRRTAPRKSLIFEAGVGDRFATLSLSRAKR